MEKTSAYHRSDFYQFTGIIFKSVNPQAESVRSVPIYLWFTGGLFSAFGVAMFYYLTPKMGMGPMMSYALTGQIIIAIIASHFGWFDLPVRSITFVKSAGVLTMITGIFLINWK
jgi:transporter family-2 protein